MKAPRKIVTFRDLDLMEQVYPHCMRCGKTGNALDVGKLTKQLGNDVPLKVVKRLLVCSECNQKDEIILHVISNEAMPRLGVKCL